LGYIPTYSEVYGSKWGTDAKVDAFLDLGIGEVPTNPGDDERVMQAAEAQADREETVRDEERKHEARQRMESPAQQVIARQTRQLRKAQPKVIIFNIETLRFTLEGATYEVRDVLKGLGWRWVPEVKLWQFFINKDKDALGKALKALTNRGVRFQQKVA
jgi:hypothetical protein